MNLTPLRIALRYLISRKSHSAVTAISVVAVIGVVVATAAIICVLSVFNGFRSVLSEKLSSLSPDIEVTRADGRMINNADSVAEIVAAIKGVGAVSPALTENALAVYRGAEMPIRLKGVDPQFFKNTTGIADILLEGSKYQLSMQAAETDPDDPFGPEEEYAALLSIGVASRLQAYLDDDEKLTVFVPRRGTTVNMANPMTSFSLDSLQVTGVYQAKQGDYDKDYVITDLAMARRLFEYDAEGSAVDVSLRPGADLAGVRDAIAAALGHGFTVKDRLMQQELNFRMIQIEKWITFVFLVFILVIASFNVVSSLSILVLDKRANLGTLQAMGASRRQIGAVFRWQSVIVSMAGTLMGIGVGIILCLLQEHYGFIKLQGDEAMLVMQSYPVKVDPLDIVWVLIPMTIIAGITAIVTSRFAISRLRE